MRSRDPGLPASSSALPARSVKGSGGPAYLGVPLHPHIPVPLGPRDRTVSPSPDQDVRESLPCGPAGSRGVCSLFHGGRARPHQARGVCVKGLASPGPRPPAAELTCPRLFFRPLQIPSNPQRASIPACSWPGPRKEGSVRLVSSRAPFQKVAPVKTPLKKSLKTESGHRRKYRVGAHPSHVSVCRQPGPRSRAGRAPGLSLAQPAPSCKEGL